jgi:hypothetical protein
LQQSNVPAPAALAVGQPVQQLQQNGYADDTWSANGDEAAAGLMNFQHSEAC